MLTLQDFQFLNELEQTNPEVYNSILDMQKRNNIDISNCCHDLLNIVTLINGHLQLLELFNPQLQNDRHLITITENINYLTDALTSISKYRHARDLKKSTTDICRLVESVIANHDDLGDIFLYSGDGAEFMQNAVNLDLAYCRSRKGRKHDPSQRVAQSGTIASLKRFYDETAVLTVVRHFGDFNMWFFEISHCDPP